jgi:hypothetical protein
MAAEAFFPRQIRDWPEHENQRDWVMAEHVNNLYAEMHATEQTLGTMPHEYVNLAGKTLTYHDVDHRLDVGQRTGERLDYYQVGLLDATTKGWNLPVCNVKASGTNVSGKKDQTKDWDPTWAGWYKMKWDQALVDPQKMLPGKKDTLTCPKTGWWMITANFHMGRSYGPEEYDQTLNAALTLSGLGMNKWPYATVASDSSTRNRHAHAAYLRCSFTYAGPWYKGNVAQFWLMTTDSLRVKNRPAYPYPIQVKPAYAWAGFTYIRALPESRVTWNPWQDLPPASD